jgi:PAS domain S-box-containing protein
MNTARPLQPHSVTAADPAVPAPASTPPDNARMLKTLLANVDGMVYRRRLDTDWTMEFVSQGCLRVTGHQPADILLSKRIAYDDLTLADDRLWVREAIRCAVAEFRSFDLEYRIVHADGSVRWVWERGTGVIDVEGRAVALEGLIQDITKRKHAETMLREAERRYHGLFDNAIEGIFRTTVEGNYLDANPALAHIYGFESPQELMASLRDIGRQLYVDPQRREEFMRIVKARGSVTGFESQVYRKNGDVIWISENSRLVLGEDGRPTRLRGHCRGHHRAPPLSDPHRASGQLRHPHRTCEPVAAAGPARAGPVDRDQLRHASRGRLRRSRPLQIHQRQSRTPCRRRVVERSGDPRAVLRARVRHGGAPRRRRIRAAHQRPFRPGRPSSRSWSACWPRCRSPGSSSRANFM